MTELEKLQQPFYRQISSMEMVAGEKKNRFRVSFSSETPCERWGDKEILLHTPEAVKLDRLRDIGVLLYAHGHDQEMGGMPIGGIENIALDAVSRRCQADIVFDEDDEKAMAICKKVEKGYLKGISVGCRMIKILILRENESTVDGRFTGPCVIGTEWEPFEISVVPLAADPTVGIGRSMEIITINEEDKKMPDPIITRNVDPVPPAVVTPPAVPATSPAPVAATEPVDLQAERTRMAEVSMLCTRHGMDAADYIQRGLTVEQVSTEILRKIETARPPLPASVQIVADAEDKFRAAATDGLLLRAGVTIATPADGANDFRGIRLRELANDCLSRSGHNKGRMNDDELFRSVMTPDSAFVSILNNSVGKSMGVAYQAAPTTYQLWTGKGSNTDFKPKKTYNISEAGELEEIRQGGEFKASHMMDAGVESVLATYGKSFGFTRQALINDDLDVLSSIPAAHVRAAKRGINKMVYQILKQNPVMADGHALFSAEHGNLCAGAAPSKSSYNEALGKMMHQKNMLGLETLNIPPKFVICDPMCYADHATMLNSIADPSSTNAGTINPFHNMMQLVMDAELSDGGTMLPYFFAASPQDCSTIIVSYLNGIEEPTLESQVGFDYLGIKWRIFIDYGVTLMDYRGLSKNPGAAN